MALRLSKTIADAQQWAEEVRRAGKRLALVPTMGFMHEGHLTLMREARQRADAVAVSLFVNPTQFGPKEDLSRYPRDLEGDRAKCESVGVDLLFIPETAALYPPGYETFVSVEQVSEGLDGASRPDHFRGVATIVTKLFVIFHPHVALFGEKDFQQLQVISSLARDLNFSTEVVGLPTVREPDGLAMSSRNTYLSSDERQRALALSKGLFSAQALAKAGESDVSKLKNVIRTPLSAFNLREDYVEIVDARTLKPLTSLEAGTPARALVAAFVGSTRLIDNVGL